LVETKQLKGGNQESKNLRVDSSSDKVLTELKSSKSSDVLGYLIRFEEIALAKTRMLYFAEPVDAWRVCHG